MAGEILEIFVVFACGECGALKTAKATRENGNWVDGGMCGIVRATPDRVPHTCIGVYRVIATITGIGGSPFSPFS